MTAAHPPTDPTFDHPPPRGPVLLLSCMDIRFLDEVVRFMDRNGLTNRYDHVILAGAALGAIGPKGHEGWATTFMEHVQIAYDLRRFKEVYIVEHRDCGAYEKFLKAEGTFGESPAEQRRETRCHRKYARLLRTELMKWAKAHNPTLRVRAFLIDLRGVVGYLPLDAKAGEPKKPSPPPA